MTIFRILAVAFSVFADEPPSSPPTKGNYALLVGCTHYPELPISMQLRGPSNDVALMKALLIERFEFEESDIATLTEDAGGDDLLPTRANIAREFTKLSVLAKEGDQVVIFLAGHGSQQPDTNANDPEDFEPDGLDEIFLPRDIGEWDGGSNKVKNAIVDGELSVWLGAIKNKGAAIWVVIDACHSGTMVRGIGEVARQVAPDTLVPKSILRQAAERAKNRPAESGRGQTATAAFNPKQVPSSLVSIYAAQSSEVTVEKMLPPDGSDQKRQGLLTYTICQILTQADQPLTYAELVQRVQAQYVNWGRTFPTPLLEGDGKDREVLGQRTWPGRSRVLLATDNNELRINAGSLHGMTAGSVLAVLSSTGEEVPRAVGHVRIQTLGTTSAIVEPCEWDGLPLVETLPASARCEPVFIDYGVSRLRITVDTNDFQGKPVTVAGRQSVVEALARLTNMNHSLVQASDNISAADWILRCRNSDVFLLPAAGWKTAAGSDAIAPFGPPPQGARLEEWLQSSLLKIARAENLKRLAATTYDVGRGGLDVVLQLDLRLNDKSEPPSQPIEWGKEGLTLFNGDRILCTIRNSGRFPIDVSVLYIDSGFGISSLFPENGEINRLQPGDKLSVPIEVTADTAGLEHLVVIAIKADGQPIDFSFLSQNTIDQALTRGGPTGMDSPVGKLFQHALFAEGTTRGLRSTAVSDHVMNRVTWNISAQSRPKSVSETSK